jgi:NAD(P)-dependent dehydrogenase (short-subunit alcohol dehydrogenase family)
MSTSRGAALVTGAAKRIGRALALDLAAAGFDLAVHYRTSAAEAQAVVAAAVALGRRAVALPADLADEEASAALVGQAAAALGPITLLVNNAAVFDYDRPETADHERWQRQMAINLRAPLVLTQGLLAQLPATGEANIVNLIDARVLNLTPHYTSYTISKAGLWVLTQHLARALAPRVRVNALAPGPVLPHAGMSEEAFAALARATPLGRGPSVEEICRALRAILEAPAMTGQLLALDGGRHLGWLLPGERDTPEPMA